MGRRAFGIFLEDFFRDSEGFLSPAPSPLSCQNTLATPQRRRRRLSFPILFEEEKTLPFFWYIFQDHCFFLPFFLFPPSGFSNQGSKDEKSFFPPAQPIFPNGWCFFFFRYSFSVSSGGEGGHHTNTLLPTNPPLWILWSVKKVVGFWTLVLLIQWL